MSFKDVLKFKCGLIGNYFLSTVYACNRSFCGMAAPKKNYLFGIIFCTYTFLTAFFGSIFIMGPFLPLMLINMKWFRTCMDFAINLWLILPGALFGWCMQNVLYFFLQRRWDLDHIYLDRMLNYFIDVNYPLQLFIFPEGTNMCKRGKSKSDSFAEKNGLPIYQYVLHPHVKGFNYLVQKLRGKVIDSIHDVTIGYPKNLCYGEKDLITGNFPLEIHVYFKSYKISDIPNDSDSLDEWCKKIWLEKEERLKKFYENGEFVGEPVHYNDKNSMYKYNSIMGLVNLFWATFLSTCVYSLWWSSFARWYSVFMVIFYVVVTFCGGVDKLQLYLHDKIKNKQNLH
nr:lysocardiolipin acyltransferase 1-like isoform X2 [Hydra vulgaris]